MPGFADVLSTATDPVPGLVCLDIVRLGGYAIGLPMAGVPLPGERPLPEQVPGSARRLDGMDRPFVGAVVLLGLAGSDRRDCRRVASAAGNYRSGECRGRPRFGDMWVVPAILLVVLCGQYQFRASTIVGLAMAMAAANGWARLPVRRPPLRLILFLIISAELYYVAGPAYYSFAACCVVHEVLAARRWALGVCCLLAAIGVKLGLDTVFSRISLVAFYCEAPPLAGYDSQLLNGAVVLLYAWFPACAAMLIFWSIQKLREGATVHGLQSRRHGPCAVAPAGSAAGFFGSFQLPADGTRSVPAAFMRWVAGTALL